MNEELLAALERLEREKGISKEVLFSAIESALASAAVKIIGDHTVSKEDIVVKVNKETGEIKVYGNNEELKSAKFGRIAAQTAKQIMIQKIREAERGVISDKYSQLEGTIISGAVHRFEKGNIIIELSDAEAVIPKTEQSPRERFRQGETIRTYICKVEKKTGGVDIILSRANPGFVRKLFEIEVPEISQGIVEIKSIAREAGERTKIAVYSKDDKIDCVGACVGMRGSRVKEIVKELSGERIDIVRWSDDIREYVLAAISPAEIYGMEVNRVDKEIKLTVPKSQLALLIGKRGRNIRLASKLVGWALNTEVIEEAVDVPLSGLQGADKDILDKLELAGYRSAAKVIELGAEGLLGIEGIDKEAVGALILACETALAKKSAESGAAAGKTRGEVESIKDVLGGAEDGERSETKEKGEESAVDNAGETDVTPDDEQPDEKDKED